MVDEGELSKEIFLRVAETSGLDVSDAQHIEELYEYYQQSVLPSLKAIHELELGGWEPAVVFAPPQE